MSSGPPDAIYSLTLPPDPETLVALARSAKQAGRFDEAEQHLRGAVAAAPHVARYHNYLGNFLWTRLKRDGAIDAWSNAVRIDAGLTITWLDLLGALAQADRLSDEVLAGLTRSHPTEAGAQRQIASALRRMGRVDQADAAIRAAMQLEPENPETLHVFAMIRFDQGLVREAIDAYRRALTIEPRAIKSHSNLLFLLHYLPDIDPREIFTEHRRWAQRFADPLAPQFVPRGNDRDPRLRLRVGYLSADLRRHAVAMFFEPILAEHDRARFEIFIYASVAHPDAVTARLRQRADQWRDVAALEDANVAQLVRQDQIDILVDLIGHADGSRLMVMARKPAPVQFTYLGYPDTTGLTTIDYRITDAWHDPAGESDTRCTERLVRIDGGAWAFRPDEAAPTDVGPLPGDANGFITFFAPNKIVKVTGQMLELWAQILQSLPGSRLLILTGGDAPGEQRIHAGLAAIDPGRVELIPRVTPDAYLRLYNRADITLDTFPYNGHTTTCESLWMGVPVVTLAGQTHVARAGLSVLSSVGLGELVAQSPRQYLERAVQLATDLDRLRGLRSELRERMRHSPLMDGKRLAREIESYFRQAWERCR